MGIVEAEFARWVVGFVKVAEAVLRNGFSPRIEFLARPIEFLNWPDALEVALRVALYARPNTPLEAGAAEFTGAGGDVVVEDSLEPSPRKSRTPMSTFYDEKTSPCAPFASSVFHLPDGVLFLARRLYLPA